jgi:single-strand DNA-binding protein
MAKSVNRVFLLGNVGKDPEIRATASGTTVANFSIATTDRVKGSDGSYSDKTEWHSLVAFQRSAEIVRDYVKKGHKLYVEGRLQTSSWDDKQSGQKRYKTEIIVGDITLLSGKDEAAPAQRSGGYRQGQSYATPPATGSYGFGNPTAPDDSDSEIPF